MSDLEWFEREVLGMRIFTARQRLAAEFLDCRGLRFLIDYGSENCEALAAKRGWTA